jgi:hypothetical protein
MLPMLRHCFALVTIIAATILPSGGCRSCSSCHDYDPPVANCDCPGGINRAGSNSTCGCDSGSCGTACGPSACGCGGDHGGYYEGQPAEQQEVEVQAKLPRFYQQR